MSRRPWSNRKPRVASRGGLPRPTRSSLEVGQRGRGSSSRQNRAYAPPEDWHEPSDRPAGGYRIVVHDPGEGFVHIIGPSEIRKRLAQLPADLVTPLEVVQLSRMTRKKTAFPCYGMQWGNAIYLYPVEQSLVEHFARPPRPSEYHEARLFGGRWVQEGNRWTLVWSERALRDFYLNNVLIHELGHLLDRRNTNARDRERFADAFAIRHG